MGQLAVAWVLETTTSHRRSSATRPEQLVDTVKAAGVTPTPTS
jgi:aryl-alcohol dehydrogenase-like predicted oxidoreductase